MASGCVLCKDDWQMLERALHMFVFVQVCRCCIDLGVCML